MSMGTNRVEEAAVLELSGTRCADAPPSDQAEVGVGRLDDAEIGRDEDEIAVERRGIVVDGPKFTATDADEWIADRQRRASRRVIDLSRIEETEEFVALRQTPAHPSARLKLQAVCPCVVELDLS